MRRVATALACLTLWGTFSFGQTTFDVTGTSIPPDLLRQNYGAMPKGVGAYDLSICNLTAAKETIVSSQIFQSLAQSNPDIQPIGRQIMLAAILHNQEHSAFNIVSIGLTSMTGVLAVLGASTYGLPAKWATGFAIASISSQPVLNAIRPVMSADQLQKFESQVLEPALVLDGGSCAERTVFTVKTSSRSRASNLSFHVR
ncbi:MAG: hypothetical protein ACJ74Y_06535 [Bryobacteraceae bacterium]